MASWFSWGMVAHLGLNPGFCCWHIVHLAVQVTRLVSVGKKISFWAYIVSFYTSTLLHPPCSWSYRASTRTGRKRSLLFHKTDLALLITEHFCSECALELSHEAQIFSHSESTITYFFSTTPHYWFSCSVVSRSLTIWLNC